MAASAAGCCLEAGETRAEMGAADATVAARADEADAAAALFLVGDGMSAGPGTAAAAFVRRFGVEERGTLPAALDAAAATLVFGAAFWAAFGAAFALVAEATPLSEEVCMGRGTSLAASGPEGEAAVTRAGRGDSLGLIMLRACARPPRSLVGVGTLTGPDDNLV